ncbi:MAG: glycoside hydrolase family 127 protein [Blautia sp.]|nr:glycoside hydrolase family 127 protein [Blautia sp.]MCM1200055.1 glycoside hydrolase family 127 protein [Bacteroides fragilis]
MKLQHQTSIGAYRAGGFIGAYQRLVKDVVIPYQYSVLCDEAPDTEKSHVVQNFINAGKVLRSAQSKSEADGSADCDGSNTDCGDGFYGMVFQDSDAAKWIEAAAYSLSLFPDKKLEGTVDKLIDIIAGAQDADGYLNTCYTIKDREKRWTNLQEGHELYCSGHMMEAACAYYEATGKEKLLQVMLKNMEHIYKHFIIERHEGCPGHPEVELALLKMYRLSGSEHCLELAEHFINTRGVDPHFYEKEKEKRDWTVWGNSPTETDYLQASAPVREQKDAVGHAVRAVYLYTAMADLAASTGDKGLLDACRRLWESITKRRMYLTGGIGSTVHGEAFSVDYDLPGDTAYAETCASIGLMFFASRMLENELNGEYADICERAFYNAVLAGMQLDGRRFFYVNPLEVLPGISGVSPTHKHDLPVRPKWYACACCPPNVARLISSFGKYAYGENSDTAFCHLFADGEVSFENGMKFTCKTRYPYDFEILYQIEKGGKLAVRIPGWSRTWQLTVNGKTPDAADSRLEKGYLYLAVSDGDTVKLMLDGTARFQYASSKVPELTGKTAVCRGPLVYCFEGADNQGDVLSLSLQREGHLEPSEFQEDLLGGTVTITADAFRTEAFDGLYTDEAPARKPCKAVAVPYYTWGNRGENQMRVWMNV